VGRRRLGVALTLAAIALATAPVAAAETCPGVRPGAVVNTPTEQCTLNFLFADKGGSYIGTAGHCILDGGPLGGDVGEAVWGSGGPVATDASGTRIGEFAYAILQSPKDFALIRLDPGVAASPQMCHYGGPTGINASQYSDAVALSYYGNGLGVGTAAPARSAIAFGMPDPNHVYAFGASIPGDSGAGIESSDGQAVGVVVTTGAHAGTVGTGGVDAGTVGITRLGPQLARANQMLGSSLALQTAAQL
jgi:hypothetical protein